MKLVTVAEMRSLEQAAMDAGIPESQLMEEAGLAVAQEAWMLLGSLEGRRIAVLVGPGNNGGDGLVAARHLLEWGANVAVYLAGTPKEPARVEEIRERAGTVLPGEGQPSAESLESLLGSADLAIDALLGTGHGRAIEADSPIGACLRCLANARAATIAPKLIAVDIPSGLDADSGALDPLAVAPDMTVTFGLPKVGMYQAPGSGQLGRVQVIDIGIPKAAMEEIPLELMTSRIVRTWLPARPEDSNKGTFGRILVVGGCRRYPGAPGLAAAGAYRAGAGLVTIASSPSVQALLAGSIPEATWLVQPEAADGFLAGEAAISLRPEWKSFEAALVGPGIGNSESTRALVWALLPDLAELERGAVLDADALNAIATFADGAERVPANAVLTPHPGEMARLMGCTSADVQAHRLEVTRAAAARFGCTVVLKGAHSIVSSNDGQAMLSPFANPLLATAGSGDVLGGIVAAYLAQGLGPFQAACLGVYTHAAAGEALRQEFGAAGVLAGEIARKLPSVVRELAGL